MGSGGLRLLGEDDIVRFLWVHCEGNQGKVVCFEDSNLLEKTWLIKLVVASQEPTSPTFA
jgi:hypothetical protein